MTASSSSTGGQAPCSPSTCAGCCDAQSLCQLGTEKAACGTAGQACSPCDDVCGWAPPEPDTWCSSGEGLAYRSCQAGQCMPVLVAGEPDGECCGIGPAGMCVEGACE